MADLFDHVLESWLIGSRKPEARAYEIAAEVLGVAPSACVFADDQQVNVDAAAAVGMRAILVTEPGPAAAELAAALDLAES